MQEQLILSLNVLAQDRAQMIEYLSRAVGGELIDPDGLHIEPLIESEAVLRTCHAILFETSISNIVQPATEANQLKRAFMSTGNDFGSLACC